MRTIFQLALMSCLLTSCATTNTNYYTQTVQSWRGGNAQLLTKSWGRPDRVLATPKGNTFYIYQTQSYRNMNAPASPSIAVNMSQTGRPTLTSEPYMNTTWNRGAMSLTCVAGFEIARNGKIVNTRIEGSSCYSSESFAKRMSNPAH